MITVSHSGAIDGIMGDEYRDAYFIPENGGISVVSTRGEFSVSIHDVSGRRVLMRSVSNGDFIPLATGSYVVTSEVAEPAKILIK